MACRSGTVAPCLYAEDLARTGYSTAIVPDCGGLSGSRLHPAADLGVRLWTACIGGHRGQSAVEVVAGLPHKCSVCLAQPGPVASLAGAAVRRYLNGHAMRSMSFHGRRSL
jgi:hypothetical protein